MQVGGCFYQGKTTCWKGRYLLQCIHYMYLDIDRRTVDVLSIVFVNITISIEWIQPLVNKCQVLLKSCIFSDLIFDSKIGASFCFN